MRQLDLEVPVPADSAERLVQTAGRLGVSVPDLLSSSAAAYARKNGPGTSPRASTALRRTLGWGARPPEDPEAERVAVHLGPEVLDLIESARRAVRWEAPDGTTAPVTLEEYVLGAAERMLRPAERRSVAEAPGPSASPVRMADRPRIRAPLQPQHLKLVLLAAAGLTTVFLLVAVVLVATRRPPPRPGPVTEQKDQGPPLLGGPSAAEKPSSPVSPNPATPGDAVRAGEAVSRWERQADAARPRATKNHIEQIDGILAEHLAKGARDDAYDDAIDAAVRDVADLYPVPAALVKAVIKRESAFNPRAKSRVGAIGLMQVMPFNARKVGLRETDLWDPERNVLGGTRLLAALLRYYNGDMVAALAAYNAKPRNPFAPLPRNGETPEYVTVVLRYYDEYTRVGGTGLGARPSTP